LSYTAIILMFLLAQQSQLTDLPCSSCHTSDNWTPLASPLPFNHDQTLFPLRGRHTKAACIQCHGGTTVTERHRFSAAETECNSCHMDIHYSDFGEDCQRCHDTESWVMDNWWRKHDLTLFPLTGAHRLLPCGDCHGAQFSRITGNLTTDCYDCHTQTLAEVISTGDHTENTDCIFCHNTRAWSPVDMSHHDYLFPIYSGNHKGTWTSCEAECHIDPNDYSNFSCGLNGVCHEHNESQTNSEHDDVGNYVYESQACFNCHSSGGGGD